MYTSVHCTYTYYNVDTCLYSVHGLLYQFLTCVRVFQHAHIENIKTVANLSNNKDVFMCILVVFVMES